MVTGGVTEEAVRSLSKAEETEVWAQVRDSVSRAAVSQHRKLGDRRSLLSPCSGGYKSQIQVMAGPCSHQRLQGESFLPASGVHGPSLVVLGFQLQHCGVCL